MRWWLALVLLGGARAGAEGRTGESAAVVAAPERPSLEASIPRGGSYGRAIDAARAGDYRRAAELFTAASVEMRREAEAGRLAFPRARTLALKAEWEAEQVRALALLERVPSPSRPANAAIVTARALHRLFLTATAYTGRVDGVFWERAATAYREVIRDEASPAWPQARIGWAGLLAAVGRRHEAALEFARLPPTIDMPELTDGLAAYFALTGQRERAFRVIADLRERRPDWDAIRIVLRISNDLDALRDDPRFPRLLGTDE